MEEGSSLLLKNYTPNAISLHIFPFPMKKKEIPVTERVAAFPRQSVLRRPNTSRGCGCGYGRDTPSTNADAAPILNMLHRASKTATPSLHRAMLASTAVPWLFLRSTTNENRSRSEWGNAAQTPRPNNGGGDNRRLHSLSCPSYKMRPEGQ